MKDRIKIVLQTIYKPIITIITGIEIARGKYFIAFREENVILRIRRNFIKNGLRSIYNAALLKTRTDKEVLTRGIVAYLIKNNIVNKNSCIIDIGGWIGDNAIVWGIMLKNMNGSGKIIAIDPSSSNTRFIKQLSETNKIENIIVEKKLASDKSNELYSPEGDITHTSFKKSTDNKDKIKTTKIDDIESVIHNKIGLFHIDVEGMEKKVLLGSLEMIQRDHPVIIYEQHITHDKTYEIENILYQEGYKIYMINEVLPDSLLDTRNFLALHQTIKYQLPTKIELKENYHRATVGEILISLRH